MADKKARFNVGSCEVGATLEYTIFSSADPSTKIISTKTISSTTETFTDILLPGIAEGTITVNVKQTDSAGNASNIGTSTYAYDLTSPTGYSIGAFTLDGDNATFTMASAEIGVALAYTITTSGGAESVSGAVANVASATESVSSIDISSLSDGTLTVSVKLTDDSANEGSPVTKTVVKEVAYDGSIQTTRSAGEWNRFDTGTLLRFGYSLISFDDPAKPEDGGAVYTWGSQLELPASPINNAVKIFTGEYVSCALRTDGSVIVWGRGEWAGGLAPAELDGTGSPIKFIYSNQIAFAALKEDGTVVCWGSADQGGTIISNKVPATDIDRIYGGNENSFVGIKTDGSVVCWGSATKGGDVSKNNLDHATNLASGVKYIVSGEKAHVAVKDDGSLVSWGWTGYGGDADVHNHGTGFVKVVSSRYAFSALKDDGSIYSWGSYHQGGNGPDDYLGQPAEDVGGGLSKSTGKNTPVYHGTGEYTNIHSNMYAFTALKRNGKIVAWGDNMYGAQLPSAVSQITNGIRLFATNQAFAVLKADGSVHAWGADQRGGGGLDGITYSPTSPITNIYCNEYAFAALSEDGSVHAWGDDSNGGDISLNNPDHATNLASGVVKIYSSFKSFLALKSDGSVVTWGDARYGQDITGAVHISVVTNVPSGGLPVDGSIIEASFPHFPDSLSTVIPDKPPLINYSADTR